MTKQANGGRLRRRTREQMTRLAPVGLLVLALGVAGFGAFEAHRAQRSHQATVESALSDYGVFAATAFQQTWNKILAGSLSATLDGAYQSALRQTTSEQCLGTLLLKDGWVAASAACRCNDEPLVREGAWAFHVTLGAPRDHGRLVGGAVPDAQKRNRVLDEIVSLARSGIGLKSHQLRWIDGGGPEPELYAFTVIEAISADTVVYGVKADPVQVERSLERALDDRSLLPEALTDGRKNRELLAVSVVRPDGALVWASSPAAPMALAGDQALPERVGGGTVQAAVLPEAASILLIGGLPENRMPLLLLVFGISGVLALMAVNQLREESQLAALRSDFVASVSHELRTPLAQVRLFVETLSLGRTQTEEQRGWALENIDRETLRLAGLVENVLTFSRAERGRLDGLELTPGHVCEEVRAAVTSFRPLVKPEHTTLDVEVGDDLRAALHSDSFRQVLINLLDNALRYGEKGQTVRVRAHREGGVVRVWVEDGGPGVPVAERDAIWEPFRRGGESVGSVAAGSGIGLSVVREIVRAHNGRVWVEDGEGGGARFVVELPALVTASHEQLASASESTDSYEVA